MEQILPNRTSLNSITPIDAPAINVRPYEFPLLVAQGRIQGHSWTLKSGRNADVDTGSVPEDVWDGDGVYTGFPTGAAETFTALSDNAGDTGTLTISYLASATSTSYQTATVTLNGTTPVDFSVSGIRIHTAFYSNGTATGFNAGIITVRHKTTTANVFIQMKPGTNQSYSSGYTVPYNSNGYIYNMYAFVEDGATGTIEGALWVRLNGASPRLRRTFVAAQGSNFEINLGGALSFPALTDIIIRVTSCSANNTTVLGGYNILTVQS